MIRQIFTVWKKNMKLLLRSRSSALIVVLGPLFLMLLVGFAFNSVGTRDVEIGIFSEKYTSLTLAYVKSLADGPFHTLRYVSEDACIDHIKRGLLAVCVVFPPDMDTVDTQVDEIEFFVDYSRINIVYQILDNVLNKVSTASQQVSLDLTGNLLNALTDVQEDLNSTEPLVASVQFLNDDASDQILEASEDLHDFSISFDRETLDTEDARLRLGSTQNKVSDIYNGHESMSVYCDRSMTRALGKALSCADDEEEEDRLRAEINVTRLYEDENKIDEAYSKVSSEFARTKTLLSKIDKDLDTLGEDLVSVDEVRTATREILGQANAQVITSLSKAEDIEKKLASIDRDIDALAVRNAENIVTPISTNIKPVIPETTNLLYLFPTFLAMVLMFSSILLSATLTMTEKKSKAYFRNFIAPVSGTALLLGTFASALFIVLLQMTVLIGITQAYFHVNMAESLGPLLVLLLFMTSLFIFLGLLIGNLFNSEDTVTLGALSACSLLLFVSDVIMPLERMPIVVSKVASYNPFVLASAALKKTLLFATPFGEIQQYLWWFFGGTVVLVGALILLDKLLKKRALYKLSNQYAIRREKKKASQVIDDV